MELIPDLNSHGLTNLIGALVLAYLILDKVGLVRRPKFMGGKKGNPNGGNRVVPTGCPFASKEHILPDADRKLIHGLVNRMEAAHKVLLKQDPSTGAYILLECLKNIEKNTGKLCTEIGQVPGRVKAAIEGGSP